PVRSASALHPKDQRDHEYPRPHKRECRKALAASCAKVGRLSYSFGRLRLLQKKHRSAGLKKKKWYPQTKLNNVVTLALTIGHTNCHCANQHYRRTRWTRAN